MPNVIGCVDGTHVPLVATPHFKPPREFYGRKGLSINCQFICDFRKRFTDATIAHPGNAHDSRVFKESKIGQEFINGKRRDGYLLGDAGYPNRTVR